MTIQVGKMYILRCGEIVKIIDKYEADCVDIYVGCNAKAKENPHTMEWYSGGCYLVQGIGHAFDIIAEYTNNPYKKELNTKHFGDFVKEYRVSKKMNVRQMGIFLGVSYSTISRIENGQKPDIDTYLSLMYFMGIPASNDLFCDKYLTTP